MSVCLCFKISVIAVATGFYIRKVFLKVGVSYLQGMAIRLAREWRRKDGAIKFAVERERRESTKWREKGNILAGD